MEHKLTSKAIAKNSINVIEQGESQVCIEIESFGLKESIFLNKKELHSLIGTLLHVQQKMK
jgi:hypothetical protein